MLKNPIRICIAGNSGSGKSTLAKALGKEFGIPVYHLDRELMYGNFEQFPVEKRIEIQAGLIEGESWVIDGNYDKILPHRIERATLAIFLNASRLITLPRVIARARKGGQPADTVPQDAKREGVSWSFVKWVAGYNRRQRANYLLQLCNEHTVPCLLLPNDSVEGWVKRIREAI